MLKFEIKNPCTQDLESMPKTSNGMFCNQCQKEVFDFTNLTKEEIIEKLSSYSKACVKVNSDVLEDRRFPLIKIRANNVNYSGYNLKPWAIAAIGVLIGLTPIVDVHAKEIHPIKYKIEQLQNQLPLDTNKSKKRKREVIVQEDILIGELVVESGDYQPPSFDGGEDSANRILEMNLKYPDVNDSNKIDCIIMVTLEIKENGDLGKIVIENSDPRLKLYEDAVLEVVKLLKKWHPATQDGKPITGYVKIPFEFEAK